MKARAEELRLPAVQRNTIGRTAREVRRAGYIPAVLYGHGVENLHVAVERRVFDKLLPKLSSSTLMGLVVEGHPEPRRVLVQDVQRHPLTGAPVHVDFHQVSLTEKIRADVPLLFEGVAPAVKDLGGTLVKSVDEVEVEALPRDLPEHLTVDISRLATFDDQLRVQDLSVPEGVQVLSDATEVIAVVTPPRTEEELEELETEVEDKTAEVEKVEEKKEAEAEEGEKAPESPAEGAKGEKMEEGKKKEQKEKA